MPPFRFHQGTQPLLISMPHVGTYVPPALAARLTDVARQVHDTDWHLERLYGFAKDLGASLLIATHSRYVIDLNRDPSGASLYPGQSVTRLCPVDDFDDQPLYLDPGDSPQDAEIDQRRAEVWQPYHRQLQHELARLKAAHGKAVLWDAHSIRSVVPRFFEGKLPDLNLGSGGGTSCDAALTDALLATARSDPEHTSVLNGRFKGGYITRQYGQPANGVHAIQLEMTQSSYMQESMPFDYLPEVAARVQPTLQRMVETACAFAQR
jgi:N-formylglutamate deformylase